MWCDEFSRQTSSSPSTRVTGFMEKVKDIRTFLKGRKETDSAKLIKTASEDAVSQSEIILVENEVQKSTMPRQH